ncbi:MAG: flagellar motor protein MotB [Fidelibacterota bacterium]
MGIIKTSTHSNGDHNWMITYASLLTAVLAFFILIVTMQENEARSTFEFADNLTTTVYQRILAEKADHGLEWLEVENTGSLGVRIIIPSIIGGESMFMSNSCDITNHFYPYIRTLSAIIRDLDLEALQQANKAIIQNLAKQHKNLRLEILIQGHTDILPVRDGKFKDNWDLSTARSYSFMNVFQAETGLPEDNFSIAGYGPFLPKRDEQNYSENRRVEIYIKFQLETQQDYAGINQPAG